MGYCALTVVTQPAIEPVTVADARAHLRVDHTDEDGLIAAYIAVARAQVEQFLNRALITQTLRLTLAPSLPPGQQLSGVVNPMIFVQPLNWSVLAGMPVGLPMAPVQSIDQVTQRHRDGTNTTLTAGTDYYADATNEPGRVTLVGVGQPVGSDVSITYTAGYGDAAASVPIGIVHAIKMLTGFFYETRGDAAAEWPAVVERLLWPYRIVTFA